MDAIKKRIPLWMKTSLSVFLTEIGHWPINIVFAHMRRAFAESGGCGEKGKRRAWKNVQKRTFCYLSDRYGHLVQNQNCTLGEKKENAPVWVFWWQGEENAPALVQRCIWSIRRHAGGRPVCVVDRENYRSYVDIPEHIEKKREAGIITLTHFSDILRMALLAEHGGLWMDATIYATDSMDAAFAGDLFTVRNPGQEQENISRWEWSGFAIGGNQGCSLFRFAGDIFSAYWLEHDTLIDYYLIDYTLRLVIDRCPIIWETLETVAPNNQGLYFYQQHFNDIADVLPPEDTWLYKLSWKGSYNTLTPSGEETVYGRWIRETEELK